VIKDLFELRAIPKNSIVHTQLHPLPGGGDGVHLTLIKVGGSDQR
jgi:hypothetical protein